MNPSHPKFKNKFPFSIGTTSFIKKADIKTNVAYLRDKVDDIEILIFESDEISPLPDDNTLNFLNQTAEQYQTTYTVHLPLDCELGHPNANQRASAIGKCQRAMAATAQINPFAYILHLNPSSLSQLDPLSLDHQLWIKHLKSSLLTLFDGPVPADKICIENLDYPFELVAPLVLALGGAICLDVGHVLANQFCLDTYLQLYLKHAKVVHLHGVKAKKDHLDIGFLPPELLKQLYRRFSADHTASRVVTLEVFGEEKFLNCAETLETLLNEL